MAKIPNFKKLSKDISSKKEYKSSNSDIEIIVRKAIQEEFGNEKYAGLQNYIAGIVTSVVDKIVNNPELFQKLVDGVIDRIKSRLK